VACTAATAFAETPQSELPRPGSAAVPVVEETHWYGYETLAVDGGATLLGLSALAASSGDNDGKLTEVLGATAGFGYVFGGPIVHWAHDRAGTALASFGLRTCAPLVLSLVGFGVGEVACSSREGEAPCPAIAAVVGAGLGFPLAVALDAALLAREPASQETVSSSTFKLVPSVGYTQGRFFASLGGTM